MHLPESLYEALPEGYMLSAVATAYLLPQALISVVAFAGAAVIVLGMRKDYRHKRALRRLQGLERKLEFYQQHMNRRSL